VIGLKSARRTCAVALLLAGLAPSCKDQSGDAVVEDGVPPPAPASPARAAFVRLDSESQLRLGLESTELQPAAQAPALTATGRLLDPLPLAVLHVELVTSQAAARASQAQFERVQQLAGQDANMSQHDLEAAETQFRTDDGHRRIAEQRLRAEWGEEIAALDAAQREAFLSSLLEGRTAIAQVALPVGERLDAPPAGALLEVDGEPALLEVRSISPAAQADRVTLGPAYLLCVGAGAAPLRPGSAVTAYLPRGGPAEPGVVVPSAALVRSAGAAWAWVQRGTDRFERRLVALDRPAADGWFVSSGFAPGERVVVAGGQALLCEQLSSLLGEDDE
jgi:hypothetical protein